MIIPDAPAPMPISAKHAGDANRATLLTRVILALLMGTGNAEIILTRKEIEMAELITTPEEKAAGSYLEWEDEALGKLVKMIGLILMDDKGKDSAWITMAAHLLVDFSTQTNSTETTVNVSGCTKNGKEIGNWKITIEKI